MKKKSEELEISVEQWQKELSKYAYRHSAFEDMTQTQKNFIIAAVKSKVPYRVITELWNKKAGWRKTSHTSMRRAIVKLCKNAK